jgi:hypothetical protein
MSTNAINGNSPPIPPMTDSPQLEASLNPTQDFGTRIRGISYDAPAFENAEEFRTAFEEAEKGAHESAKTKFKAEADLVLYVAKIQSYTSERGVNAHLRKAAGIPAGFERWYADFRARYDLGFAFKTMQHKIAQLHGGCDHCGRLAENDADHKKSCILYYQFGLQLQSIDAKIDKIQKSFSEMKVYIGDEFDNQQRIEALSTIDVITESYRGWTKGLTNGPNSPQTELARLQHATRNLMRRSTYGNSTVIALAMSYERDMGVLTKEDPEFRNQASKAYLSDFKNALNPTDSGSLTARRIAASERIQSIEKDLAARQPLYWTAQQTWCLRTGEGIYRNDEVHIMTGTLQTGFVDSAQVRWVALGTVNPILNDMPPECPATNLYLPSGTRRDSSLAVLNQLSADWVEASNEIQILDKAIEITKTAMVYAGKWGGLEVKDVQWQVVPTK